MDTKRTVELTDVAIIELAYLYMDMMELIHGRRLSFEQANCYDACLSHIRGLLVHVDPAYVMVHERIQKFYHLIWPAEYIDKCRACGEETLSPMPF